MAIKIDFGPQSKDRASDQWHKTEGSETNSQLIFDKGARNTKWSKENLFNKCTNKIYYSLEINSYTYLPHTTHKC